jgi:hypothetical protein
LDATAAKVAQKKAKGTKGARSKGHLGMLTKSATLQGLAAAAGWAGALGTQVPEHSGEKPRPQDRIHAEQERRALLRELGK